MINFNEYFEGDVKSLGYDSRFGKSTVGVMNPGKYTFGTAQHEIMTIVEGLLMVKLPGQEEFEAFKDGETFEVAANSSFDVKCTGQVAYLCKYR